MTASLLERLQPLCLDAEEETRYPTLHQSFSYTREGIRYAVATDARLAVFLPYDGDIPDAPVDFDPIFARYQPSELRVDTNALAEFCGKPEYYWRHQDCDDCQGHWPDVRKGMVGDVMCDLNLLARGLALVLDDTAELSLPVFDGSEISPIFLRWPDGWVVLMPMRYEGEEDLPRFEVTR